MPNIRRETRTQPIVPFPTRKVEIKNMQAVTDTIKPTMELRDDLFWDEQLDTAQFREDIYFVRPGMPHIVDIEPTYGDEEEEEETTLQEVCKSWWQELKGFLLSPADRIYRWVRYTSKNKYELFFQLVSKLFIIWLIHAAVSSQRWQDPTMYVPRETTEGDTQSVDRHLRQNYGVVSPASAARPEQSNHQEMVTPELQKVLQGFRDSSQLKSGN